MTTAKLTEKEPRAASTDSASKMPDKADRATCASPAPEHNGSTKASTTADFDLDWQPSLNTNPWTTLDGGVSGMQTMKGSSNNNFSSAPVFGGGKNMNNTRNNYDSSYANNDYKRSVTGNGKMSLGMGNVGKGGKGSSGNSLSKGKDPSVATVIHHHPPKDQIRNVGYPVNGGQTLLIAYFPWEATEKNVFDEFSKYCNVKKVHLVMDKQNTKPRCFGFVKFWTREDADKALEAAVNGLVTLNDSRNHVWHLKAEWAKSGDMIDDSDKPEKDINNLSSGGNSKSNFNNGHKGFGGKDFNNSSNSSQKGGLSNNSQHSQQQQQSQAVSVPHQFLTSHQNMGATNLTTMVSNSYPAAYSTHPHHFGTMMRSVSGAEDNNGSYMYNGNNAAPMNMLNNGIFSADVSPGSQSSGFSGAQKSGAYNKDNNGGAVAASYGKGQYGFQPIVWDPMNIHASPSSDGSANAYMDGSGYPQAQNSSDSPTQDPNGQCSQQQQQQQQQQNITHQLAVMQQIAALSQHLPPNLGQLFQQQAADSSQIVLKSEFGGNVYPQQNFYQYGSIPTFQPTNVFQPAQVMGTTNLNLDGAVTPSPSPVGTSSGVFSGGGNTNTNATSGAKSATVSGQKIDNYYGNGSGPIGTMPGTMPSAQQANLAPEKFVGTLTGNTSQKVCNTLNNSNKGSSMNYSNTYNPIAAVNNVDCNGNNGNPLRCSTGVGIAQNSPAQNSVSTAQQGA